MNPIRTNKPVFFGDDGEVLKSGKIYIGQPNQWPLDFPKTVTLQDSAGSQFTAEQPLTTNNQGRIVYNGKSIIALVEGDYSILVRDRNGVTVGEGYTPFVANALEENEISGVTQVGLLLSDIKQFDVTPGETVRNVGKSTTTDGLGADWLVTSATGEAADDVDLIDFDNGTQGRRTTDYSNSIAQWLGTPVGGYLYLQTNLSGVSEPPINNSSFRYVKLTAGLTGSGEYNEGALTGESTTGTAPIQVITAEISEGPLSGETINLINSENRYLMPGETAGDIANDQMQQITGSIEAGLSTNFENDSGIGAFTTSGSGSFANGTGVSSDPSNDGLATFDSADSPDARTGDSTNVKHVQATAYLRIR